MGLLFIGGPYVSLRHPRKAPGARSKSIMSMATEEQTRIAEVALPIFGLLGTSSCCLNLILRQGSVTGFFAAIATKSKCTKIRSFRIRGRFPLSKIFDVFSVED